jgi:predicted transposase YbfD/YdcC
MPKKPPALTSTLPLLDALIHISDPRGERNQRHPLMSIMVVAVCAVICGADNWVSIEAWGNAKKDWLSSFIDLPHGIASHDTFGRVFALLSPDEFQEAFIHWTAGLTQGVSGKVVAIDGKTLRRSFDKAAERPAIHMVSAWCTEAGLALGQVKTEEKSNEITAIPALLKVLHLAGAIITIDAMGCQKKITQAIRAEDADYCIAVKDNQPRLAGFIQDWFGKAEGLDFVGADVLSIGDSTRGHGREEERTVWLAPAPEELPNRTEWADVQSIIMAEALRTQDGKTSVHHRFYISSLSPEEPARALRVVRDHWGIENNLHWVLDVAFREDESRIRVGHAAENMSRLRHIALNLIKREKSTKVGVKTRRLRAGWDNDYLLKVLGFNA